MVLPLEFIHGIKALLVHRQSDEVSAVFDIVCRLDKA